MPTPSYPPITDADIAAITRGCATIPQFTVSHVDTGTDLDTATQRARGGGHVLAFTTPRSWDILTSRFGWTVRPAPMMAVPTNPLVAQRSHLADGCGPCHGTTLTLERAGVLHHGNTPDTSDVTIVASLPDGSPVAVRTPLGDGWITVVTGTLPPGGSAASAAWVATLATLTPASEPVEPTSTTAAGPGQTAPDAGTIAAAIRAGTTSAWDTHPDVPHVHTSDWPTPDPGDAQDVNDPILLTRAGHAGRHLPDAVYTALIDFADTGNPGGALVISGAPVGDIAATPTTPHQVHKPDLVSEMTVLTCARMLGQPVGYAPEHGGDLVQNICPTRSGEDRQVSTSSKVDLDFHTEAAFHPHRPRYLLLLCLRGDPDAATTLCSVDAILPHLSPEDLAILRQPRFTTGIDESYTGIPSTARSLPRPVLTGTFDRPRLWLDIDTMWGTDTEAQGALSRIALIARTRGTSVTLDTGDILIVDNDRAVHGRRRFTPRYDGTDRWLQRSLVVADHTAIDSDLVGRIITTEFVR